MKLKKSLVFAAVCAAFTFSETASANAPFGPVSNFSVSVHDFGDRIIVSFAQPIPNTEGCNGTAFAVVQKSHPLFNQMFAAILSAFTAKTPLSGFVNGCDSYFSVPLITRIDLKP